MRRRVHCRVALAVLVALSLAGCLGTGSLPASGVDDRGPTDSTRCTGNGTTPEIAPTGSLPASASGFELTASDSTVERGARITFELTNVATEQQSTGTRHRYALQRRAGGGWTTVTQFSGDRSGFNATAVFHDPGRGFEWTVQASAAGFSTDKFVVCDRLPPGEYRFVYDAARPVAVEFELTERAGA